MCNSVGWSESPLSRAMKARDIYRLSLHLQPHCRTTYLLIGDEWCASEVSKETSPKSCSLSKCKRQWVSENMGRAKGKYMQEVSPVEAMSNPYHGSTGNPRCASSGGNITFVCETSRRGERCARGESKQGPFFQDKNSPCKLNNDARFRRPDERSTAPQPVPSVGSCVSQLDVKKSSARRPKNI